MWMVNDVGQDGDRWQIALIVVFDSVGSGGKCCQLRKVMLAQL